MRAILLAIASLAVALPATAQGQHKSGHGFHSGAQANVSDVRFGSRDGFRHDRRRHRDFENGAFFYDYYREYQGDTAWKSDSFNDWWHDRPDRAYPRWVTNNQNCERKWWAGSELRC